MDNDSCASDFDWMGNGSDTFTPPPPPKTIMDDTAVWQSKNLRGVVDMGSNGIRFSVTDLSSPRARILPTVHVYRLDISLYDAQFDPETGEQIPIPKDVISRVTAALVRFKIVCKDLGVPQENITIVATEATRVALNSAEFIHTIRLATGLTVTLLRKEDEGRVGALGVASGFSNIKGLMMDLGGGSTQITWIISQGGNVRISEKGSISFPYGAAALTRLIKVTKENKSKPEADKALEELRQQITCQFEKAYKDLDVPENLEIMARREGGFPLYLSGGGFRGWGYLLLHMSQTGPNPHPISVINGYTVDREKFANSDAVEKVAHSAKSVFRVSDRRRSQVPAVAFLIHAVSQAIPLGGIRVAHFCQGGVREGLLFRQMPPMVRAEDPLEAATQPFAPASSRTIASLLAFAIPEPEPEPSLSGGRLRRAFPASISSHVMRAFANALYLHASIDKELASTASLYSTSTGMMASIRGVSHEDRARLALMLESRYMGELPPRELLFKSSLIRIITPEEAWWAGYLGRVGYLISRLYPAGQIDERKPRVLFSAEWASMADMDDSRGEGGDEEDEQDSEIEVEDSFKKNRWKKGKPQDGLRLIISIQKVENDHSKLKQALEENVSIVEHVGKRKHWIGGKEGWGMKVQLKIVEEDIL